MIISITNTKGGVGKTATAVHLGAALAARGKRTLLIDLDPAHGLTNYFALEHDGPTISDVLIGAVPLIEVTVAVRPCLFLAPANASLEEVDARLTASSGPEVRLHRALRKITSIDFVLIDCPGAWLTITRNAVFACHAAILPINSESPAMVNALDTIEKIREMNDLHGRDVATWPLLTCYRQNKVAKLVEELSMLEWPNELLETRIRRAERVNESVASRETLSDLTASAAGGVGADYDELASEIIKLASVSR